MLKMLLRTVDLKELRNTQDFLNKRTTNNQAAHDLLAFPLGSAHRFFNTPEKAKRTLKPRSTSRQPRIPATIQKKASQRQRCDPHEPHDTSFSTHGSTHGMNQTEAEASTQTGNQKLRQKPKDKKQKNRPRRGGGQMFACFQPNIWVGPAIGTHEILCWKRENRPGRGEVRLWRVFNPKTQVSPF
jgi:hypothetical protein